jgi:hypothetical protein
VQSRIFGDEEEIAGGWREQLIEELHNKSRRMRLIGK